MLLEKQKKFFLNFLDSNITIIVKDLFIFPTEDTQKIIRGREKVLTVQKLKKKNFRIFINPR